MGTLPLSRRASCYVSVVALCFLLVTVTKCLLLYELIFTQATFALTLTVTQLASAGEAGGSSAGSTTTTTTTTSEPLTVLSNTQAKQQKLLPNGR